MNTIPSNVVYSQPKWIGKSATFWGALIALATTAYQVIGPIADATGVTIPVTPDDIRAAGNVGVQVISAAAAAVGFGVTIWGRIRAGKVAQPVSIIPNAPVTTVTVKKPPATTGKSSG